MDDPGTPASAFFADQIGKSRLPGDPGIYIFILFDICFYCVLFAIYVNSEWRDFSGFRNAQSLLETNFGLFNTLVLLTSSWLVALAGQAARRGSGKLATRLTLAGAALGLLFLAIKATEYTHKFEAGIFITTNIFFMYWFFVTFLHAMHVVAGTIFLLIMARRIGGKAPTLSNVIWLESAAVFWHVVDFLWVMIFALFYLISWK